VQLQVNDDLQRRIAAALTIWSETVDPSNTVVEMYLRSRGLSLDAELAEAVRFHPATRAMVALFRDVRTDEPCGIHRTFLDREGRKLRRKMLGRAKLAAIKLDPDESVGLGLHLGEGIETCLSARQQGIRPVWALGSAGAIADFPVLRGLEAVGLLLERDDAGANERACEACAERYVLAGCEVTVIDPGHGDLNDVLQEVA
jgi:hypothetical protein